MMTEDISAIALTEIKRQYIVITPCKNEAENLPNLVQSIVAQTIRPILWAILDDGSTDKTGEIIAEAVKKYGWIKSIRLDGSKRDLGLHLASIMKRGFDFALEYCEKNGIDCEYLGNVDGDLTVGPTFFENLIVEFEKDPKLGIASGGIKLTIRDHIVHVKGLPVDEPSGGDMLIRKKCFDTCGGIPVSYAMDSVLKAKARLRGWDTKRFEENIALEIRDVSCAEGYWKGFMHSGKAMYYLNFHPLHVITKSLIISFRRPGYTGIAYLAGYLSSAIRRENQVNDEEVRKYFRNKWKRVYKRRLFR